MGKAIDWETREYAEDLYIIRGHTLDQVAAATGVSLSQIKTWSAEDAWAARRDTYRADMRSIREDSIRLRKELISKALASKDPQDVYAAAAFERMALSAEKRSASAGDTAPAEISREIHTPEDAIAAMQEAVQAKINLMLCRPGEISLSAIKDMKQALALLANMQSEDAPASAQSERPKELSEDTRRAIREIYGLK